MPNKEDCKTWCGADDVPRNCRDDCILERGGDDDEE